MIIGRFAADNKVFYGVIKEERVLAMAGSPFDPSGSKIAGTAGSLEDLKVLAPCEPTKAVCVGINYRDHAVELDHPVPEEPVLFMKPSTAVVGTLEPVVYPPSSRQVDYEAELAVVIGRTCRNVKPSEAANYILGCTCGNDITARDLQRKDGQWIRAKSFDTFLPLGPYIVSGLPYDNLSIYFRLNGELRQSSSTSQLIFSVPELVSFISGVMTLLPGDVIMTGTPGGVGPVKIGDEMEVEIEGIGRLINDVVT